MTRLEALTALKEAVEAGDAGMQLFGAVWPPSDDAAWRHNKDAAKAMHGSLDAARALHEAVLPGWRWKIDEHYAEIWERVRVAYSGEAPDNPARAWLLAILAALIAKEKEE